MDKELDLNLKTVYEQALQEIGGIKEDFPLINIAYDKETFNIYNDSNLMRELVRQANQTDDDEKRERLLKLNLNLLNKFLIFMLAAQQLDSYMDLTYMPINDQYIECFNKFLKGYYNHCVEYRLIY